jgi:hypothetical protein
MNKPITGGGESKAAKAKSSPSAPAKIESPLMPTTKPELDSRTIGSTKLPKPGFLF